MPGTSALREATHLARLPRATALAALEDLLDAHCRRVLPEISGRQIDLFGRLNAR